MSVSNYFQEGQVLDFEIEKGQKRPKLTSRVEKISTVPKDSSAYHTGMLDLNDRALALREDVMSATPYMYVSVANILFATIWIAAIIGIFTALKRKKEQLKEADEVGI